MTPYHWDILIALATYYTLTRAQIQRLCCPSDKSGRATRYRLLQLLQRKLINKTHMEVCNPAGGAPAPVYFPSRAGLELLAIERQDESFLSACTLLPDWRNLFHYTCVADAHITLRQALARQTEVQMENWIGEWDLKDAGAAAKTPERRYKLYQLIQEKPRRLVANPDAGFLLSVRGFKKVYLFELCRGTSGVKQVSHSKPPGFAAMAKAGLHRTIFPQTNMDKFSVLMLTTTPARRDALRQAIAPMAGSEMWKFAAMPDFRPETALCEAIWYPCAESRNLWSSRRKGPSNEELASPQLRRNLAAQEIGRQIASEAQPVEPDSLRAARGTRSYLARPLAAPRSSPAGSDRRRSKRRASCPDS